MDNDKELSKCGHITKEMIEEACNDIFNSKVKKDRDLKLTVFFSTQEEADSWMKMFNNLMKEEIKKMYYETQNNS